MQRHLILIAVINEKRQGIWSLSTTEGEKIGTEITSHVDSDKILLDDKVYACKDIHAVSFTPDFWKHSNAR